MSKCVVCSGTGGIRCLSCGGVGETPERYSPVPEVNRDRLDRYVCAALTGLMANPAVNREAHEAEIAKWALSHAKAALEAADKEGG